MLWILLSLLAPASHASYKDDYLKLRICGELRINRREMPVETCFNGQFNFTPRRDLTDFRWRLRRGQPPCTGTIYEDAGTVHLDEGCDR